jgi:predicted Zn-dependent peptidase
MLHRVAVAFALVFVLSLGVRDARAEDVPYAMRDTTLPNGLRLVTDQAGRVPLVSVVLAFSVGTTQDPPNRNGLANLTLDLMARRSKHVRDGELVAQLDELATTWRYRCGSDFSYLAATVPPHALERILWLFSDAMGFSAEALDQTLIDSRIALSKNGAAQVDDANAGLAGQLRWPTEFPEGHPYHHLWENKELTGVSVAEVAQFQKRYFVPRNAMLAITGWVDRDEVVRLVTKYFASLPGGASMQRPVAARTKLGGETRIEVGAPLQSTTVSIMWPTPPTYAPGDAELDAVAGILDGVRTTRLRWELDTNKRLVSWITAHQRSWLYGSEFAISATVRPGHTPDEVIEAVDTVLRGLQTSPPTTDDLNGALLPMLIKRMFGYESSLTRGIRYVDWILGAGTTNYLRKDVERYQVTPAQVLAVAARELPLDRRVITIVTPDASAPFHGVLRRRTFRAAP